MDGAGPSLEAAGGSWKDGDAAAAADIDEEFSRSSSILCLHIISNNT